MQDAEQNLRAVGIENGDGTTTIRIRVIPGPASGVRSDLDAKQIMQRVIEPGPPPVLRVVKV